MILGNVPDISFKKSPRANEPERICSESAVDHVKEVALHKSEAENFQEIYSAAKTIRTVLEKKNKWKSSGSFADFTDSTQLSTFIRRAVFGPKCATEDMWKKNSIKRSQMLLNK